jgi:hypothetical protein
MTKTENRHREPKMLIYPLRIEESVMASVAKVAKKEEWTRAHVIRNAISEYLRRRAS